MSRTKHHRNQKQRHLGEDFWGKRAGMANASVCTTNKRITISRERMQGKELILNEIKEANKTSFGGHFL